MTEEATRTDGDATSRPPTAARSASEGGRRPTTPPPASRSSRASRPSASARACTSARPTPAACTTSSGRSSTTRSTRRWPARPTTIQVTHQGRRHGDGRGRRPRRARSASIRPARTRSRSSTPSSTPAASSAAAATRSRAACTASASASSTPCRRGCASSRRATASSGRRSTSAASRRPPVKKIGPQGTRRGHDDQLHRRPRDVRDHRVLVRPDQPAPARVGLPHQGRLDHAHRRADRSRALVLLRGRPPVVRPAPQPEQGGPPQPPDLRRAQGGRHGRRGRPPVQRLVHRERPRVRQQHQHGRRRHARHRASAPP